MNRRQREPHGLTMVKHWMLVEEAARIIERMNGRVYPGLADVSDLTLARMIATDRAERQDYRVAQKQRISEEQNAKF